MVICINFGITLFIYMSLSACVNVVQSQLTNGTSKHLAIVCANSFLPEPGPSHKTLLLLGDEKLANNWLFLVIVKLWCLVNLLLTTLFFWKNQINTSPVCSQTFTQKLARKNISQNEFCDESRRIENQPKELWINKVLNIKTSSSSSLHTKWTAV